MNQREKELLILSISKIKGNTMNKKDIKIFVTYKDKHKLIKSDIITPIQTGRAIAKEKFEGMIGDDTGDNISKENPKLSETSAQYWVWKHYEEIGNPEYVGFMHYRRHFIFNDTNYKCTNLGCVNFDEISDSYIKEVKLYDPQAIEKKVIGSDIIVGSKIDCRNFKFLKKKTPREAFKYNDDLQVKDYDLMLDTVVDIFPEYKVTIDKIENGHIQYWYNMFIMKKEYFMEYCNFWYSIISKLSQKIDTSMYCENATRILGYLSERLLTIFVINKMENEQFCKIKELPISFIKNTKSDIEILPKFNKNSIPIVFLASNYFVPYLAVTLKSIKENSDINDNYDIIILTRDMDSKNKKRLESLYSENNFSIRFLEIVFDKNFYTEGHVTIETYMRILLPKILKNYEKVLYLDCDLIVNRNLAELYNTNIENYCLGAVKDYTIQAFVNNSKRPDRQYINKELKIKDVYSIFNGGVLLLNIKNIDSNYEDIIFNMLCKNKYRYFDQDVLNIYFQDKVFYLDAKWNFTPFTYSNIAYKYIPKKSRDILDCLNHKNIGIVHYNSNIKPWFYPSEPFSDIWWTYAKKTPYYELIIKNMINHSINEQLNQNNLLTNLKFRAVNKYSFNCINYWKCKLLRNLTFGKTREHYIEKKYRLKNLIRLAEECK